MKIKKGVMLAHIVVTQSLSVRSGTRAAHSYAPGLQSYGPTNPYQIKNNIVAHQSSQNLGTRLSILII